MKVANFPSVSVITPSYNQGHFIEETLRSVLLQGYRNLEYIVVDGGSTDESVEIIRKYEKWLTCWVSEPDGGQSDAINKGFAKATGEILAWLNSDDVLMPGAINQATRYFDQRSEALVIYGDSDLVDAEGRLMNRFRVQEFCPPQMFFDHFIPQPSAFIRRKAIDQVGDLNESLHFCMDYDLWLRIALVGKIDYLPGALSKFRVHSASKGSNLQGSRWRETADILSKFLRLHNVPSQWKEYYTESVGRAHWQASIAFFRQDDFVESRKDLQQALIYAPAFLGTVDFSRLLVGTNARQTTVSTIDLVDNFFEMIPALKFKRKCYRRARARAQALLSLNDATPARLARESARDALKHDLSWLSNRHVVRRAIR